MKRLSKSLLEEGVFNDIKTIQVNVCTVKIQFQLWELGSMQGKPSPPPLSEKLWLMEEDPRKNINSCLEIQTKLEIKAHRSVIGY